LTKLNRKYNSLVSWPTLYLEAVGYQ